MVWGCEVHIQDNEDFKLNEEINDDRVHNQDSCHGNLKLAREILVLLKDLAYQRLSLPLASKLAATLNYLYYLILY